MVDFLEGLELIRGNSVGQRTLPVKLKVLRVSGTIKKLKKKIDSYKNIGGVNHG